MLPSRRIKDLTGQRHGKLIVIEFAGTSKQGKAKWLCRCDCGNEKVAIGYDITRPGRRYCSNKCQANDLLTPEEQSRRACKGAHKIRQWQLDNNSRKQSSYVKYYGKHEHRVVAEKLLGRPLRRNEVVHHIDGNPHNNFPSNLFPCTQARHVKIHMRGGRFVTTT